MDKRRTNVLQYPTSHKKNIRRSLPLPFSKFIFHEQDNYIKERHEYFYFERYFKFLSFQRYLRRYVVRPFIKSSYIDLSENTPILATFQTKVPSVYDKFTSIIQGYKCNHESHLSPISVLPKLIRVLDNTS